MADNKPKFSFGAAPDTQASPFGQLSSTPASTTTTSHLFGAPSAPATGPFAKSAASPSAAGVSPFGQLAGATPSVFGRANGSGGTTLGGTGTAASAGFGFGQKSDAKDNAAPSSVFSTDKSSATPASAPAPGAGLFGRTAPAQAGGGLFGRGSTPQAGTGLFGQPAAPQPSAGVSGKSSTPQTALFPSTGSNVTPSPSLGVATPATGKPTLSFGSLSTTPAGPPPAMAPTSAATSGGIFGTAKGRPNPFAPATTSAAPVQSNPFAGLSSQPAATSNLFGKAAPAAQTSASPSSGGLFGRATTENQPGFLANNKDGVQPAPSAFGAPSVFGAPSKLRETSSPSTSALSAAPSLIQPSQQTQANNAPKTSNIFGSSNTASGSMAKTQPASATSSAVGAGLASSQTAQPSFVFPSAAASTGGQAQSGPSSSSTAGATASPFGALSTSAQSTSASATTVPAPSLFSTLGQFKPASAASAPAGTAATAANAASTSATPASVTNTQTGPASSTTATETSNVAASAPAAGGGVGASLFGTSTSGAAATPQSRLKNKSMEEIITTWAKDLSDYQKDFHRQADMVASWDQLLVENAEKIQKLYASTFEAERASSEVERQLSAVVGQQEELSGWLDRYEREVDEILAQQAGPGEGLQGPDQERERTYKLAEKLSDRLDVMGKDLKTMVEEINAASSSLSKTTKPDDPLSQIVKVLNSHLSSLQWIDQNAAALQAKVAAAQKTAQGTGSNRHRGLGEDAADDFYRSYLGRR